MSELPNGWANATVNELIAGDGLFVDGDWVETKDQDPVGEVRLTQLADVGEGRWRDRSHRYMTAAAADRLGCTFLQVDDVLVARMPDPLGRASVFPGDPRQCVTVVDVAIVRPGSASVLPAWLMWAINAPTTRIAIEAQQAGTTRKRISRKNLGEIELPVPPRSEQERIVTAIEEAFSKLDAGEAGLRTVRQLLKRMREAVLAAAVTGRLVPQDCTDTSASTLLTGLSIVSATRDALPNGWAQARVGDVARVGSGTTPQRGNTAYWQDGTVPWVTSGLITRGIIAEAREFVTLRAVSETSLQLWPVGSLLVAMYGEGQTRGRCAELRIEATCNQACAAIVLHDDLRPYKDFVRLFFDANYTANRRLASGGVQPNLNAGLIKDMILELPPLEEQARIVAEVERQFSFIEACEHAVGAGLARAAALRRSVLKSAFEGQLVPQDPSDEWAFALLERIRAERAASDRASGGRRRRKMGAS